MKLSTLFEILLILIIISFAAETKPVNGKGIFNYGVIKNHNYNECFLLYKILVGRAMHRYHKRIAVGRQEPGVVPSKPVASPDDDDDFDIGDIFDVFGDDEDPDSAEESAEDDEDDDDPEDDDDDDDGKE